MEKHDLLIIADATASMKSYLQSLNTSLPQIISISAITGCFSRVAVLAYRDYTDSNDCIQFSGWLDMKPEDEEGEEEQPDIVAFARSLKAKGGGDYPEAAKTALAKAYSVMRGDAKTIILFYTDAPPHGTIPKPKELTNPWAEVQGLTKISKHSEWYEAVPYYGAGPLFVDWVCAAKTMRDGEKKVQIFALLEPNMLPESATYYNYLCEMTNGACLHIDDSSPDTISKTSIELLLLWMGFGKPVDGEEGTGITGKWSYYLSTEEMADLKQEADTRTGNFFPVPYNRNTPVMKNVKKRSLDRDVIIERLPKKPTPARNPIEMWNADTAYRDMASKHLMRIIQEEIGAIAINPVFGGLWRAVCRDKSYDRRDDLVDAFSKAVGDIEDPDQKKVMKDWLEESYNFSAEIQSIVDSVEDADQFPCVFLDPTISFAHADDNDARVEKLSRGELLEISRSCDPRILRRLGRILTRLTYVEKAEDMPAHIAKSDSDHARKIPLALATTKYGNQFWQLLLHTITPGTQLAPRAAALLAALTIRIGISFLADSAEHEMAQYKDKWSNVEVPETWALSCLRLLLDANKVHQKQSDNEQTHKPDLLNDSDILLFERLIAFKALEHNLDTPLVARIPWTPTDTVYPIGPVVTCQSCRYPRSVSIMGPDTKCGVCLGLDPTEPKEANDARVLTRASREATSSSGANWVECNVPSCRAQYVVYDVESRKVRPKCHYCRQQSMPGVSTEKHSAPVVDCSKCSSRMIWPEEYRPEGFDEASFACPACQDRRQTIVEVVTSPKELAAENSTSWLATDADRADASPFTNRSLFYTVSTMGAEGFMRRISLFPGRDLPLTQRGKPILNTIDIMSTIKDLVAGRKAPKADCSLCFSSFRPALLAPACGGRGCSQRTCKDCASSWYGSNASGTVINAAALACPFCRRLPAPHVLRKYGNGVHAVKDLKRAMEDRAWIFAWCSTCSAGKEFLERDCARGAPPALANWTCEACIEEARRADDEKTAERVSKMKPCPKCGTMTEKISGCGHITCPVEGCGVDWCYFCGEEIAEGVYDHMAEAHGGIFDNDALGDGDEFYNDEEMEDVVEQSF